MAKCVENNNSSPLKYANMHTTALSSSASKQLSEITLASHDACGRQCRMTDAFASYRNERRNSAYARRAAFFRPRKKEEDCVRNREIAYSVVRLETICTERFRQVSLLDLRGRPTASSSRKRSGHLRASQQEEEISPSSQQCISFQVRRRAEFETPSLNKMLFKWEEEASGSFTRRRATTTATFQNVSRVSTQKMRRTNAFEVVFGGTPDGTCLWLLSLRSSLLSRQRKRIVALRALSTPLLEFRFSPTFSVFSRKGGFAEARVLRLTA